MGSTSSKAARKLPKEKPAEWAGSGVQPMAAARLRAERPLAFEHKNEAIETDAKDPQFMEKLGRVGQVHVDRPTHANPRALQASDIQSMYHSRRRSEEEAARPPASVQNRLLAVSLAALLEARKSVVDRAELEALAARYRVDAATLRRLGRVVSTPSVDESTAVRTTDMHGEESLTIMAQWVDPRV